MRIGLAVVSFSATNAAASAFQAPHYVAYPRRYQRRPQSFASASSAFTKNASLLFQTNHGVDRDTVRRNSDIFLLSLEGTLLSTIRSKSMLAIRAALKVWPSLIPTAKTLGMDTDTLEDDSWSWLVEKLWALSSITQQGNTADKMLGCDAVFLVRVLLEEQLLDGGRSNGRGGKYGGRFHPGSSSAIESNGSVVGSRPLTVGEIFANWEELRQVLGNKYPFIDEGNKRKSDPLPRVRQVLEELYLDEAKMTQPLWHPLAFDTLLESECSGSSGIRQNSVLLLGHEAQLPSALSSFAAMGISFTVHLDLDWSLHCLDEWLHPQTDANKDAIFTITSSERAHRHFLNLRSSHSIVLVVPKSHDQESQSDMIQRIVLDFHSNNIIKDSNHNDMDETGIFVVHSSLDVLKECKSFLGEDRPIMYRGMRKCFLPSGPGDSSRTSVDLFLPEWADSLHPTQKNEAEMDPWLNIVTESQFLESITAKIVSTK
ncbi:hypothetical protein HJC23_007327 [Cyclotella cryptica]|uniref:Uncharacterized protein n=1 Tax=Cyclotella cryptica TaxID=29204 RepID=A0ABD3PDC4_9STRA|eukprot:CCRYP_015730-RA/>CCRYP_015730-RA protein AED:0.00 eAED:0.00 QI:153/1/1/1/1/1/2/41/484